MINIKQKYSDEYVSALEALESLEALENLIELEALEALEHLDETAYYEDGYSYIDQQAYLTLKIALKRNEPMTIHEPNNHHWHCYYYYCPNCGRLHIRNFYNYCPMCGQKLDWGDEK